ncbi:hypothetical protein ACPOL_4628 [Acidisarcina polymorpha]|uniref:Uncharacterized protein n=1 Tax=Acidisarcina polymorpha TaxID=2211140 RepID=A0A2Z5G4K7_9BACT|nr:hypothetical protein [Acidisarcina polymorpha]AXC13900.1 hypothetical protein ACPOL_4628 [Acidisarcina polymorpha]
MVTGSSMPGFAEAFNLSKQDQTTDYSVEEIAVTTVGASGTNMVNVLWPGEEADVTLHFINKTSVRLSATGIAAVVRYGTSVPEGDVWTPHIFKISDEPPSAIKVDVPAGGSQDVIVHPAIGIPFGGYALIVHLPQHGAVFAGTFVRTVKPDMGRVQFPTYALDTTWDEFMNEGVFTLFEKLGIKGMRMGGPYQLKTAPHYAQDMDRLDRYMQWAKQHDVTVMLTIGAGDDMRDQPLNRPRTWLSPESKMLDTKDDRAWSPEYDDEFQQWTQTIAEKYGWPGGNLNAVELWNEPWEAVSISGWGADIPRYRDIFTHMALGVEAARKSSGVKVLIGGTCSSSNTLDKLFPDGSDRFLKWLDFASIHYQALAAPSLIREWTTREGSYGPVRIWDTESWMANSEDRVAGVIASMRAQGQSRTAGIFDGNVYDSKNVKIGSSVYPIVQAWSPAAAVAATQKFIGQREFHQLLFQNGLPWVFVFDGLPKVDSEKSDRDDGTVVVMGDLTKLYEPARTLFRSVALRPDAKLTIQNPGNEFVLYDFYGNPVPFTGGAITVPLNGLGYFLRTNGAPGSFDNLLRELRTAKASGYDPVEIVARDLTQPVSQHPALRLSLTNVLNRSVKGRLTATLGSLTLNPASTAVELKPNETREISLNVLDGQPDPTNLYALKATFDAGVDGSVTHSETMHVNTIVHRTITVDGDLSDWAGVLPEQLPARDVDVSLTEKAWLPFKDRANKSSSTTAASVAYVAYDERYFYFAAEIPDTTPDPGMLRFATRDDDSYFYPDRVTSLDGKEFEWPKSVRHYSYRKNFDVPSGSSEHDNVQIAFNVLDRKPWLSHPPGVMPRFITYWDTDYEYALNPVASAYGGGTEIWRLQAPGIPRKHFFPRQPKSPIDGGPVKSGKLVVRQTADERQVEAAIPWSEMPDVKRRFDAGETVKFTCRVNDNKAPAHELAAGRSVSKYNGMTFHNDWETHWANELEFGVER